ncbi:hypothetical protein K438DRAFT_302783 [Mycena galopus ATCC 62051]|nr:hypothetical protein K438DRAFT_302783 [Mycena galopus ATCC 62051]
MPFPAHSSGKYVIAFLCHDLPITFCLFLPIASMYMIALFQHDLPLISFGLSLPTATGSMWLLFFPFFAMTY